MRGYDPTEYCSMQEAARSRAAVEREFGAPKNPEVKSETDRLVNDEHFRREAATNDEFGWHGTTPAQLRKKWGLA